MKKITERIDKGYKITFLKLTDNEVKRLFQDHYAMFYKMCSVADVYPFDTHYTYPKENSTTVLLYTRIS